MIPTEDTLLVTEDLMNPIDETLLQPIHFDELCDQLAPLGIVNSPSELHGLLCGKLSGGAELTETRWLLDAVEFLDFTQAPDEKTRHLLTQLFYSTQHQLREGFEIKLLLPEDDLALSQRAAAIGQWCYGFLTGFGSSGKVGRALSSDTEDALRDLAAIAHIAVEDSDEDLEADEADYMEVTEYVRMLAASLFMEYATVSNKASEDSIAAPASNQVH